LSGYYFLAPYYDALQEEVNYAAIADWCENCFSRAGRAVRSVLDLACGTGTLSYILADRGFDVTGADISAEMLSAAESKRAKRAAGNPLFICQAMDGLDLYGTVDAAVCTLDGVNYLAREELRRAFGRAALFIEPGGVFIFDVHSSEKFEWMHGRIFRSESADSYCVWSAARDDNSGRIVYDMDVFAKKGSAWIRSSERHIQYEYGADELRKELLSSGFRKVVTSDEDNSISGPDAARLYIFAER